MSMLSETLAVLGKPMAIFGIVGQICFSSRFLVQWIASEKKGKSVVPIAFWYLSIIGGLLVLIYGLWRREPIIILGQTPGVIVYTRNLVLIYRERALLRKAACSMSST